MANRNQLVPSSTATPFFCRNPTMPTYQIGRSFISRILSLSVGMGVAACSSSTEPDGPQIVSFSAQAAAGTVPSSLRLTDQGVVIRGTVETPCSAYRLLPRLNAQSGRVNVTLRGESTAEICTAVIARFEYTAVIRGIQGGPQRLTVRHEIGSWAPVVVLDTTVVVP